jgi:hypothetical protein
VNYSYRPSSGVGDALPPTRGPCGAATRAEASDPPVARPKANALSGARWARRFGKPRSVEPLGTYARIEF